MNQFTEEEFEEIKAKGEELYNSIDKVHCPYFNESVVFNASGFEHLKFKNRRRPRLDQDQYTRFKYMHLAPQILASSHTLQGIRTIEQSDEIVVYYEFIAVLEDKRIRIIVKQNGDGEKIFWSIIPFWKMDKKQHNDYFILENLKRIKAKHPPEAGVLLALGYSFETVRGRTLQALGRVYQNLKSAANTFRALRSRMR